MFLLGRGGSVVDRQACQDFIEPLTLGDGSYR